MAVCARCGTRNPEHAKFCLECGTELAAPARPRREVRKVVTVLFTDVTGSTSLGERTDPESLRHVMSRYFEECKAVLGHHGGTVEKFIGDAVMAVFGIPQLHEDDALRAVRAATELRTALEDLNEELERTHGFGIAVRIGVNTGEVVAGDPDTGQALVTGDAVNVAARLEQAAEPGEILIGAGTFRLVKEAVRVEEIEPFTLRGKTDQTRAYRLLDVTAGSARVTRQLDSPMVGRDNEQLLLRQAFERCLRENACHLFTILGIAGVGKSRLVTDFIEGLDGATVLAGRCLPYGDGITFWPVANIVSEAAGIDETENKDEAYVKILKLLSGEPDAEGLAARVSQMIGLIEATSGTEEMFWAARRLLETMARRQPLIVVFDDIHWAEPTLLDFVEHLADWTKGAPVLVVALARPELLDERPSWAGGKFNATTILLEPLSAEESHILIANLLGQAQLSETVEKQIAEAAEGTPLFVEEMLAMLIDDGLLERSNGRWTPTHDLSRITVPPTIQALLAARLDRLAPEERAVLERASVVGKVFWQSAVAELTEEPGRSQLGSHLLNLVRRELIRPDLSTFTGEQQFRFRHILVRDAAYESMAKETRAELHETFAGWLEQVVGDRHLEYEEIVGYHLEQSVRYRAELGLADKRVDDLSKVAARRLKTAGRRALGRGDMPASVSLLSRAIALMPEDDPNRPETLIDLADAQIEGGDFDGAMASLTKAKDVAASLQDDVLAAHAEVAQLKLDYMTVTTDYSDNLRHALDRLIPLFERVNDSRGLAKAWTMKGLLGVVLCRATDTEMAARKAVGYAREAGDMRLEAANVWWVLVSCMLGSSTPEQTLQRCGEVEAELSGDSRQNQAAILVTRGVAQGMLGKFEEARRVHEEGRAILADLGLTITYGATSMGLDWILSAAGDYEASERALREGIEILDGAGEKGYLSTAAGQLADVLYKQGRPDEAERYAALARDAASPDDVASQSIWRQVQAKILAHRGHFDKALHLAQEAVSWYEDSDYIYLHGDALMDLCEVLDLSGDHAEALAAARKGLAKYEQKGHVPATATARERVAELERKLS
ncbi:MAG: adenylate/guanylate cyclase domain-containing protein [Actinomycetota bacterium]